MEMEEAYDLPRSSRSSRDPTRYVSCSTHTQRGRTDEVSCCTWHALTVLVLYKVGVDKRNLAATASQLHYHLPPSRLPLH